MGLMAVNNGSQTPLYLGVLHQIVQEMAAAREGDPDVG